ncbi:MAG: NAD(P)H-hydrate dehydratase [Candidatus Bathyarchaeia archaeon]
MITSREMKALETNAEYFGVSRLQLMENAGKNIAMQVASRFHPQKTRVAIFCGLGGNGGDGIAAARHLACLGFKAHVLLAGKQTDINDKEARKNWQALKWLKNSITIQEIQDSSLIPHVEADVVIDALLGIGLKGNPRPPILQLIKKINEMNAFRIAVDVPTGINSDTGEVLGEAVKANLTVTFHKTKLGLEKAKEYTGELVVADIGLPTEFESFAGPGDVPLVVKPRPKEAHKGDFGRLLIVGGSEVFSGAPAFVAMAALRSGVDLAYVAAPEKTAYAISTMSPNLITIKLEGNNLNPRNVPLIKRYLVVATAVVLGPGLGMQMETVDAIKEIVALVEEAGKPLLLDADGLKAFAQFRRRLKMPAVLTPHAGEYQTLTGKELPSSLEDRMVEVRKTAEELGATVLLKGPVDVVSDGCRVKLNFTGNAGMTVGGTGDVLSGIVGCFLAQKADPFEAAVAGAFINGACGDFAFKEKGYHMVATDLVKWIPRVMNDPMSHVKVRESAET